MVSTLKRIAKQLSAVDNVIHLFNLQRMTCDYHRLNTTDSVSAVSVYQCERDTHKKRRHQNKKEQATENNEEKTTTRFGKKKLLGKRKNHGKCKARIRINILVFHCRHRYHKCSCSGFDRENKNKSHHNLHSIVIVCEFRCRIFMCHSFRSHHFRQAKCSPFGWINGGQTILKLCRWIFRKSHQITSFRGFDWFNGW